MKPKLLIDNGGAIACSDHAPYPGSGTWYTGQWRPMRVDERAEFTAEIGRAPSCPTCDVIRKSEEHN
jgi:hypothetical protein